MKTEKIKWGIIGPGKIAKKFTTSLKEVKDAELFAVASRSTERATAFAKEAGAKKAYGSYEEMLQDEEIDVVYVATPHVFHYEHTLLCLDHGKPVLCEKPFAINREQVEEMISTAREKQVFLMEAMWTPFLPHIQYLMEELQSGKYGSIRKLTADFGFDAPFDENGRLFRKSLGGGSLLDIGIYPVFLALHTLGVPENIEANAKLGTTEVDENCDVYFRYPNGAKAELKSSITEKTPTTAEFELEKASIRISSRWHEPSTVSITTAEGTISKTFDVASYGYEYEAKHIQEMLRKGRIESNVMTPEKSLELITVLDEIRKQIGLEY
ncbi:Gfo/Idh/MocA family protein [Salinimicrobium sp. TH3]|uniref:Gfo/Idh/MocA family protein n=1 Tax=Salinimicrobium sp. TH3 TaxID=2997342 RepID=UPI002273E27B|nr:Gfo/Idh/MocA family oxidoreductase [Salinimicrobium sp. TH3]MCY2686657.1 Gfo/Idh/MocA family oxidoreductase [Salinimicrobium sp. TH3]